MVFLLLNLTSYISVNNVVAEYLHWQFCDEIIEIFNKMLTKLVLKFPQFFKCPAYVKFKSDFNILLHTCEHLFIDPSCCFNMFLLVVLIKIKCKTYQYPRIVITSKRRSVSTIAKRYLSTGSTTDNTKYFKEE